MNKKTVYIIIGVAVIVGICSFYLGSSMAQGKSPNVQNGMVNGGQGQFGGNRGGMRGGNNFTGGTVISKDATSITVQGRDGSSKIIFFTANTPVMKMVAGTANDIVAGKDVSITGTPNTDGSISAESIQIRPTMNPTQTQNQVQKTNN